MTHLKKISKVGFIILMLCMPVLLHAQTGGPGFGGGGDNTIDNPVPFDGGVYCLVAVAIVYGLIKAYTKKFSVQNKVIN